VVLLDLKSSILREVSACRGVDERAAGSSEMLMREQRNNPRCWWESSGISRVVDERAAGSAEVLMREQRKHPMCWWESSVNYQSKVGLGVDEIAAESSEVLMREQRNHAMCWWESSGIIRGWPRCWWEHRYHPRLAEVLMREQRNHSRWWVSSWITRIWPSGIETTICLLLLFVLSDTDIWILLAVPKSSSIDKLDMDTMKIETLVSDIMYPLGLGFHFYTHQIYWADFNTKTMGR